MKCRVKRFCVFVLLFLVAIDTTLCQVTPGGRSNAVQPRQLASATYRRQRRLERDMAVLRNQVLTLEYRLTVRLTAVITEKLQDVVTDTRSHDTQIEQIVERLGSVESDVQALQGRKRVSEGDGVDEHDGASTSTVPINVVGAKIASLEQSILIINHTIADHARKLEDGLENTEQSSNQCQKCEESVADLRTEIATNLTRVQDLFSRKKSAGIVDQQINPVKSRRSNPATTEAPFDYGGHDVLYNVIGEDEYDDYGDEDNTSHVEYNMFEEPLPNRHDSTDRGKQQVSNLPTQDTREIINGLYMRLRSQESLMESLFEMYTNNSRILDGFENRFDTIINAFDRADRKDTELLGGVRSNRRMLEAFAKSFREIVTDGRRQSSAIVNLRKRIRNIEGTAPKSFARNSELQALRVFVNRTIARLPKTKPTTIEGSVVSNEPIKRLLNAAIDSLNYTIIRNQEAIERMKILPTTVQFIESELSSYSVDIESIPQLRNDVEGIVSMKNLVLRNSADLSKLHDTVTTNKVSLVEFYSKLNDLGIDLREMQQTMIHFQMENSALRSGIGQLNSSALNTEHRLSSFKTEIAYNISETHYKIQQLSSTTTATENKVQIVDTALANLKYNTETHERSFEIHKATLNSSLHRIDNRLSQLDRSMVLMDNELSKANTKINEEATASINRYEKNKDSIEDVEEEIANLKSTFDRTREEDFNAATERNDIISKIDGLTADVGNHDTSLAALQRQIEEVGVNVINTDSRINSLENTASQFIEFEEVTERRFRTELNITRQVRRQLLEQVSKLQSIDVKMNELIKSVKTAQNNIVGQREEFKALLDRSTNQSVSLQRLTQKLQSDFAGSNVTQELYRKINELHQMISNVKNEISVFSAKEIAQNERFDGIENDVSSLQTSSWEHRNKISDQDNLLDRLKSELNQTNIKERSTDVILRNTQGLLQQIKQRTERNELDLTDIRNWRDEVDYAVYFLDKITISLANSSRDFIVTHRRLATRVTALESEGQSSAVQIDTVRRIVDSNAEGLAQQYSQINDLVRKDVQLETSLKTVDEKVADIDHLQSEISTVSDRTSAMSTLVSKHEKQIENLGLSTKIIRDEVNSTVNRLNLLVVNIHDENGRMFKEQNDIIRDVGDLKRKIYITNSTTISNQVTLLRLTDDILSYKARLRNISLSIDEIEAGMGTSSDLRQVNNTLRKLLRNMSRSIIENSEKLNTLDEATAKISDDIKSMETKRLTYDISLHNLTSAMHSQESQVLQLEIEQKSSKINLQGITDELNDTKVEMASLKRDTLNVTQQWMQTFRKELSSVNDSFRQSVIDIHDKINSSATTISLSIQTLAENSIELISNVKDNITQIQYGVDEKLDKGLQNFNLEQNELSKKINRTVSSIEYLTGKYELLDRLRLENLKKSELSEALQADILNMTGNQTQVDELGFLRRHIPRNFSIDDVDASVKLAARLGMIAMRNDESAKKLILEINKTKLSLKGNEMEIEQNLFSIAKDIGALSKNISLCKKKVDDNSIGLANALDRYVNVSSQQYRMKLESAGFVQKIENMNQKFEDMEDSMNLLRQDFVDSEQLATQRKREDELKIKNVSYTMMQNLNQTSRELKRLISANQDGFNALNESLQLKISGLEVSNVRKQLDLKILDLNYTVHLLSNYLQDYSSQFTAIARYIEQMKNSTGGLPMANAMRCSENSPFQHLCERKYVKSVGAELSFVRYRDLFEHIFNESERVKDVPSNLMILREQSDGIATKQKNLESTLNNYTQEMGSAIAWVTNETLRLVTNMQLSGEEENSRIHKLEKQINSSEQTLQNTTNSLKNLQLSVQKLQIIPKNIYDVREEMVERFGNMKLQINRTFESSWNELIHLKHKLVNVTNDAVSRAERMSRDLDANVTQKMSIMNDRLTSALAMASTRISSHDNDIESLVAFRVELGRNLKNIRNVLNPLVSSNKLNRTSYTDSTNGKLNTSLDTVIKRFTQTLLGHMNGTDRALNILRKSLQKTYEKTDIHTVLLEKMKGDVEYFNESVISNKEELEELAQQIERQNKKTDALFESAVTKLNLTSQNMRLKISSNQERLEEMGSKFELDHNYTNVSIVALLKNIATLNDRIASNVMETGEMIKREQNKSATHIGAVEKTCNRKIDQLKDVLAEMKESSTDIWGKLENTTSSIFLLNNSIAVVDKNTKRNLDAISNQTRFYEMEVAALTESITDATDTYKHISARLENDVNSLFSKHVNNVHDIENVNKSLRSEAARSQNLHVLVKNIMRNITLMNDEILGILHDSKVYNGGLMEQSRSISALWDESNLLKIQLTNHSYKIELIEDLEEKSSKYAGTLLDMITATMAKHDSHQNSFSRHWAEIQQHKSSLDNITARLADEISDGTDKFLTLSREISNVKTTSDLLWLRFERINSTVGEFREDNEMLLDQVDNLTSTLESLHDENIRTTHEISLNKMERHNLHVLNESLYQLQASLQNMSESEEGSTAAMEASGLEMFNQSIQNQMYSLMRLVDDMRSSVDQDLREISHNTSDIVRSVSSHLLQREIISNANCSCDKNLKMLKAIVQQQNRSIHSLSSKFDEHEIKLIKGADIDSQFTQFKTDSSNRLSDIVEELELNNISSVAMTVAIQKLVTDSEKMKSEVGNEIMKLKKENSQLLLELTDHSTITSSLLKEMANMKNHTLQTEMKAHSSTDEMLSCKDDIAKLSELMHSLSSNLTRLENLEDTLDTTQQDVTNQIQTFDIMIKSLQNETSSIQTNLIDSMESLQSISVRLRDSDVQWHNLSEILSSRVHYSCEVKLHNLSRITKAVESRSNLRDEKMQEFENALEMMAVNSSKVMRMQEGIEHSLQDIYSDQTEFRDYVERLDNSFINLSNLVGQNDQFDASRFSELRESQIKLERVIQKDTAVLRDRISGQNVDIENLFVKNEDIQRRLAKFADDQLELEQNNSHLKDYFIKSQAQDAEKFLTITKMLSDVANDTDSCRADAIELRNRIDKNIVKTQSVVSSIYNNMSQFREAHDSDLEWMKNISHEHNLTVNYVRQIQSSLMQTLNNDYRNEITQIKRTFLALEDNVTTYSLTMHEQDDRLRKMEQENWKNINIRLEIIDNLTRSQSIWCNANLSNLRSDFHDFVDWSRENQTYLTNIVNENLDRLSSVFQNQTEMRKSIASLDEMFVENVAEIESLHKSKSELEKNTNICLSSQNNFSNELRSLTLNASERFKDLHSRVRSNAQDLKSINMEITNQYSILDSFNHRIGKLDVRSIQTSIQTESNISNCALAIEHLEDRFHSIDDQVKTHEDAVTTLSSKMRSSTNEIDSLKERQISLKTNQSSVWWALLKYEQLLDKMESVQVSSNDSLSRIEDFVQDNKAMISAHSRQLEMEKIHVETLLNKSTIWDLTHDRVISAEEKLKTIQNAVEVEKINFQKQNSRLEGMANVINVTKGFQDHLLSNIKTIQQEFDMLQNTTMQYMANNDKQESLIESQFEENMMIKSMVNLMKEQLRNLTQDDISLEEEIKNTTNAILILARRLNKQSSAIRLLSDQADTQGEQMKAKLDNVSIALMTLHTQNNIKSAILQSLESRYYTLRDKITNHSVAISNNGNMNTELQLSLKEALNSIGTVNESLSNCQDKYNEMNMRVVQQSNDSVQTIERIDSKFMKLMGSIEDSLQQDISAKFGEIEKLEQKTIEIGKIQNQLDGKLSNVSRQLELNFMNTFDMASKQRQELSDLREHVESVTADVSSIEIHNRNLSLRTDKILSDISQGFADTQNNMENALRDTKLELVKNITANLDKIKLLAEVQQQEVKIHKDALISLKRRIERLNETFLLEAKAQRAATIVVHDAIRSNAERMNVTYFNVSQQILALNEESQDRYNEMNKGTQALGEKQNNVDRLLTAEAEAVASLTKWVQDVSKQVEINQADLWNVSRHVDVQDAHVNNQEIDIKVIGDVMAEIKSNLTLNEMHVQNLLKRYEGLEMETIEAINNTQTEATHLIGLLERSVDGNLTELSQKLDALIGISRSMESNQSSNKQEISALIDDVRSVSVDFDRIRKRQHYQNDAIAMLNSVHNDTELQMELLSDEVLKLRNRSNRREQRIERHHQNITSLKSWIQNISSHLELNDNTFSVHRKSLQKLKLQIDHVVNQSTKFEVDFKAQKLSSMGIADRLNEIDNMLLEAIANFTRFVVSSNNQSEQREKLISSMRLNILRIENSSDEDTVNIKTLNENLATSKLNIQNIKDAVLVCSEKQNESTVAIADITALFSNLSSRHGDLKEQVASNTISLNHLSIIMAKSNRSQNVLRDKITYIDGSISRLSDSVDHLYRLYEQRGNIIENLQHQNHNVSSLAEQLDVFSNQTLEALKHVNNRTVANEQALDCLRRNVSEIAMKSTKGIELLTHKGDDLEMLMIMMNETMHRSYSEAQSRQRALGKVVQDNFDKSLDYFSNIDHIRALLQVLSRNLTDVARQRELDATEATETIYQFRQDLIQLKNDIDANEEDIGESSLLLAVVEGDLSNYKENQRGEINRLEMSLMDINAIISNLTNHSEDYSAELDIMSRLQEKFSTDMKAIGKTIFNFYNQTAEMSKTSETYARSMQEQNQEKEAILAKLDDVQTKVEMLMKCNLKNYTIDQNDSSVLLFADILTQLRKDVTQLNTTAWNALPKDTEDLSIDYGGYDADSDVGSVDDTVYFDFSSNTIPRTMETPYLLSNLTTVLQGIENVFYFIVPKTKEVLHDLKNRQDSVTISFGNVTADVRNLQDILQQHLIKYFQHKSLLDDEITIMSGKVKVIDDALTELNQSFGQTNRNVGDTFEEIDISLLDGSTRLSVLERILPFMESKQQNAIDMLWRVNQTVNTLKNSQQSRDDQFGLMYTDILELRQEVEETSSKMTETEESFEKFSNTSNRYRISLWKDVLDIINSTMEKVETGSEVLLRGGERRDMLLVNAEKSIRLLTSNVAELQKIAQDADLMVSAVAQETKWNGNQVDTCLQNVDDLNIDISNKLQYLENMIRNQSATFNDFNNKLDSIQQGSAVISNTNPIGDMEQTTAQPTASPVETVMAPTNLQVFNVDATSILLSWDASPTSGVTGYQAILQNAFNEEEPPIELQVQDVQAIFERLPPDTAYTVELYARKGNHLSTPLSGVAVTSSELSSIFNETSTPSPTTAPSEIIWQCNFERECDIYQATSDDFDWQSYNGSTSSGDTGPTTDHTIGDIYGRYLYIEASNPRQPGEVAKVATSLLDAVEDACLEFFYHMYGAGTGDLSVWVGREKVWEKSGSQGNAWQKQSLEIHADEMFRLVFEAVRGADFHSDIAIDDIIVTRGRCPTPLFECDFEDPNSCGFVQDNTDDFDWERIKGATPSSDTGPLTDHTLMTPDGYYMFMESSTPHLENQKARLITPELRTTKKNCLQFFYHMHGLDINSLSVYIIKSISNARDELIWSKTGSQGNDWNSARVNLDAQNRYRIIFEATVGADYHGDIGLDDVQISPGSCDSPVCSFGERFGDFCYVIDETPRIYTDAQSACQEHDGNLATIKTKEQQAFIQGLVTNSSKPMDRFWIGIDDLVREGRFVYADKTPLVQSRNSFNAWATGEPNDPDGSEDCVAVDIAYKQRRWSDLPCDIATGYICQYHSLI